MNRSTALITKINLVEGVIKLPPVMRKELLSLTFSALLIKMINDGLITERVDKINSKIGLFMQNHNLTEIKNINFTGARVKRKIKVDYYKMDKRYLDMLPDKVDMSPLNVVINFNAKRLVMKGSGGSYNHETNTLAVELGGKYKELLSLKNDRNRMLDQLTTILDGITLIVEHELSHYVQYKFLKHRSEKQLTDKRDDALTYEIGSDDYYLSTIEYQPYIAGLIAGYDEILKKLKNGNYTDDIHYKIINRITEGILRSGFFRTLKERDPTRYKKGVRTLVAELERQVEKTPPDLEKRLLKFKQKKGTVVITKEEELERKRVHDFVKKEEEKAHKRFTREMNKRKAK